MELSTKETVQLHNKLPQNGCSKCEIVGQKYKKFKFAGSFQTAIQNNHTNLCSHCFKNASLISLPKRSAICNICQFDNQVYILFLSYVALHWFLTWFKIFICIIHTDFGKRNDFRFDFSFSTGAKLYPYLG